MVANLNAFDPAHSARRAHFIKIENPRQKQDTGVPLATPDADARREIMARIEQNLREAGIMIQPYWRSVYRTYRKGVHGCEQHQSLEQHFEKVWLEA